MKYVFEGELYDGVKIKEIVDENDFDKVYTRFDNDADLIWWDVSSLKEEEE